MQSVSLKNIHVINKENILPLQSHKTCQHKIMPWGYKIFFHSQLICPANKSQILTIASSFSLNLA